MSITPRVNLPQKIPTKTCTFYLEMLAIAIGKLSLNQGSQRKEIWKFFLDNFTQNKEVNYKTFLLSICQLKEEGKLEQNNNGYLWILPEVYKELYDMSQNQRLVMSTSKSREETAVGGSSSIDKSPSKFQTVRKNCIPQNQRIFPPNNFNSSQGNIFPAKNPLQNQCIQNCKKINSSGKILKNVNSVSSNSSQKSYQKFPFSQLLAQFTLPEPLDEKQIKKIMKYQKLFQEKENALLNKSIKDDMKQKNKTIYNSNDLKTRNIQAMLENIPILPDIRINPMQEIANRVRAEIKLLYPPNKDKQKKEDDAQDGHNKKKQIDQNKQAPSTQCQANNNHNDNGQNQQFRPNNIKCGKQKEVTYQKQQVAQQFELGFKSGGDESSNIQSSLTLQNQEINGFGLQTPKQEDSNQQQKNMQNNSQFINPEDLYPNSRRYKQTVQYKKNKNFNNTENQEDILSINDIQECPSQNQDQQKDVHPQRYGIEYEREMYANMDFNSSSDSLKGNQYIEKIDIDNRSFTQNYGGQQGNGQTKRKQQKKFKIDTNIDNMMDNYSQISGQSNISRYTLRPRKNAQPQNDFVTNFKKKNNQNLKNDSYSVYGGNQRGKCKQSQDRFEAKSSNNVKQSNIIHSKSEFDANSFYNKSNSNSAMKRKNDNSIKKQIFRDDLSEISNGFGAYKTRNYQTFQNAMINQMVTRNKFSQIITQRPQINQLSSSIFQNKNIQNLQQTIKKAQMTANQGYCQNKNQGQNRMVGMKRQFPYNKYSELDSMSQVSRVSQNNKRQKKQEFDRASRDYSVITRSRNDDCSLNMSQYSNNQNKNKQCQQKYNNHFQPEQQGQKINHQSRNDQRFRQVSGNNQKMSKVQQIYKY